MANSLSVTVDGQNLLSTQKMFQLDKKFGKGLIEESSKENTTCKVNPNVGMVNFS